MPTSPLYRILAFVILFALVVSYAPQATPSLPAVRPIDSSSTLHPAAQATQQPAATRKPKGTHAPKGTPGHGQQNPQGRKLPQSFPTSSYVTSDADFNLILGRPTTNSITASLYAKSDRQVTIT
jgi:hypothetical protein